MREQSKITILMVDDDSDDRLLFNEAVVSVDKETIVITANNGIEAIEILKNATSLPNLIFLDVNMPLCDGWQCLTYLKNNPLFKDIPIIMYSTSDSRHDVDRAYDMGALCYCTKPDTFGDLIDMLRLIIKNLGPDLYAALSECKDCKSVYTQGSENYKMLRE